MNAFLIYVIQSAVSIAVLFIAYKAFFANQSFFFINRIILLLVIGFGFFGPLLATAFNAGITWGDLRIPGGQIGGNTISETLNEFIVRPGNNSTGVSLIGIIGLIYFAGVALQLGKFGRNFYTLMRLLIKSEKIKTGWFTYVLLPVGSASFSFFNRLFLDKKLLDEGLESNQIIAHEQIHSRQKHSVDIILLEILVVVQWFNPFIYRLKKSVVENHEYLADRGTLNSIPDISAYKLLLLKNILTQGNYTLTNNFSYSLIKKRLKMMEKESSRLRMVITSIGFMMVFAIVTISCSNNIEKDESNGKAAQVVNIPENPTKVDDSGKEVYTIAETMPEYPGGESELFKFMGNNIIYPEQAKTENIEGKVYVQFMVDSEGNVVDVSILRGIGGGCDEEAMRVVKLMHNWIPGEQDGRKVNVQYNLPINFKLK